MGTRVPWIGPDTLSARLEVLPAAAWTSHRPQRGPEATCSSLAAVCPQPRSQQAVPGLRSTVGAVFPSALLHSTALPHCAAPCPPPRGPRHRTPHPQGLSEREEQLEKKKLLLEKKINDEVCAAQGWAARRRSAAAGVISRPPAAAHARQPHATAWRRGPTRGRRRWCPRSAAAGRRRAAHSAPRSGSATQRPARPPHHARPVPTNGAPARACIDTQMEKAREFTRQKKKSQALMCLKKKKMYEQQLERMEALTARCGAARRGAAARLRRGLAHSQPHMEPARVTHTHSP